MSPAKLKSRIEKADPDATFENLGVRQNEDGDLLEEKPRRDFINATPSELGDGVPPRNERSSVDIYRDLLRKEFLKQPFAEPVPQSAHVKPEPALIGCEIRAREWQESESYRRKPKPKRGRPPKEREPEPDVEETLPCLRLEAGLSVREVARLMNDPRFNRPIRTTDRGALNVEPFASRLTKLREQAPKILHETFDRRMSKLMGSLPWTERTTIPSNDVKLYREFASGNYKEDELAKRHGFGRVAEIPAIENAILRHLSALGLIRWKNVAAPRRADVEHELETQQIARSGGGDIGGGIRKVTGPRGKFGVGNSRGAGPTLAYDPDDQEAYEPNQGPD